MDVLVVLGLMPIIGVVFGYCMHRWPAVDRTPHDLVESLYDDNIQPAAEVAEASRNTCD